MRKRLQTGILPVLLLPLLWSWPLAITAANRYMITIFLRTSGRAPDLSNYASADLRSRLHRCETDSAYRWLKTLFNDVKQPIVGIWLTLLAMVGALCIAAIASRQRGRIVLCAITLAVYILSLLYESAVWPFTAFYGSAG